MTDQKHEQPGDDPAEEREETDRKSTRLNSSHSSISYAVFCLKKKSRALELGADPGRVHLVPNGVDTERFRPLDRARARDELGLDRSEQTLLAVGRLDKVNALY